MAINFSQLPTENPYALPPVGIYKAKVVKAEMKLSTSGNNNLNLTLALSDGKGRRYGNMFDMLSESTHQAVLYKIGRFVAATKLNLVGNCELKDLAKIVVGKELCVDVIHQKDNKDVMRANVKLFGSECYWPIEMYDELAVMNETEESGTVEGAAPADDPNDGEPPFEFNAADGMPAAPAPQNPGTPDEY